MAAGCVNEYSAGIRMSRLSKLYLMMSFWIVMLTPLFPNVMGTSQVHVNLLLITLAAGALAFLSTFRYSYSFLVIFVYYSLLQLLLILGMLFSDAEFSISEVPSIFRPLMSMFILFCVGLLVRASEFSERELYRVLILFLIVSVGYLFVEIFFYNEFSFIVFDLYKREYRESLLNSFTSFYGTTYYSGFIYYSVFALLAPFVLSRNYSFAIFFAILTIVLTFVAQSKLMVVTLLFHMCLFFSVMIPIAWRLFLIPAIVGSFLWVYFSGALSDILVEIPLSSASSLNRLLYSPETSGTLNIRVEQIVNVFNELSFLGIGTGQGVALESWLSSYLYRYGLLGVVAFLVFNLFLANRAYVVSRKEREISYLKSNFMFSLSIWFLLIPFSQLSSVMIDGSKFIFVYCIFIALVLYPGAVRFSKG